MSVIIFFLVASLLINIYFSIVVLKDEGRLKIQFDASLENIEELAKQTRDEINKDAYCCNGEAEEDIFDTAFVIGYRIAAKKAENDNLDNLFKEVDEIRRVGEEKHKDYLLIKKLNDRIEELMIEKEAQAIEFSQKQKELEDLVVSKNGEIEVINMKNSGFTNDKIAFFPKEGDYVRGVLLGPKSNPIKIEGRVSGFADGGYPIVNGKKLHPFSCEKIDEPIMDSVFDTNSGAQVVEVPVIDWTKPVAFPKGYIVPKGTMCVALTNGHWGEFETPTGTRLKALETSLVPLLEHLEGKHRTDFDSLYDGYVDACIRSFKLAPLNPKDHPNHPEFNSAEK